MKKIQDVSPTTYQLVADGGLKAVLIVDNPDYSSAVLSSQLTDSEQAEGRRKTSPTAYRAWLLGRLAAKEAAGQLWRVSPAEVEILTGPAGGPLVRSANQPPGHVSISHTTDAAAAVAGETPVGVDLERLDRRVSPKAWQWAFSPEESALAHEAVRFPAELALWCAKEAAAKSWGRGLLNHLNQVRAVEADWAGGRISVAWLKDAASPDKSRNRPSGPIPGTGRAEVRLLIHNEHLAALARAI